MFSNNLGQPICCFPETVTKAADFWRKYDQFLVPFYRRVVLTIILYNSWAPTYYETMEKNHRAQVCTAYCYYY